MFTVDDKLRSELTSLIAQATVADPVTAAPAQRALAVALQTPLRKAVLEGNIHAGIFAREAWDISQGPPEYAIDLIAPGTEGEYAAITMPDIGAIPMSRVEGDRIYVNTYRIGNGIEVPLNFLRRVNWNVLGRMMEVLDAGFTMKMNDDAWHVLLKAAGQRNVLVYDADASQGNFTPRLITLAKTIMRRNGGGNSNSVNRSKLTDLYLSPEALDDIRSWGLNYVPDAIRAQIYTAPDGGMKIYDVNLHDIDELGVGQEFQSYFTGTLGYSLQASDVELCIGLDLSKNDSFVMPETQPVQIFEDNTLHRQGLFGLYGSAEVGWGALDTRRIIACSF